MAKERIDDLLAMIPNGWDFWIGSSWNDAGENVFTARISKRSGGEQIHIGHYSEEIEREAASLRQALIEAISAIKS